MGKNAKKAEGWPEAKKLCRLNQNDIEMAKRLGMSPKTLLRSRPSPQQRWKLPVKDWIQELHFKKFGQILGEPRNPLHAALPVKMKSDAAGGPFWEEYRSLNEREEEAQPVVEHKPYTPVRVQFSPPLWTREQSEWLSSFVDDDVPV